MIAGSWVVRVFCSVSMSSEGLREWIVVAELVKATLEQGVA